MDFSALGLKNFQQQLREKVFLGHKITPELFGILTVYFVQGILGLARLAVSFFLKDDLGLTPANVAALTGIASLPWIIKPAFGFLSDGLPLFGYRRRSYLIISGLLGSASWLALATVVDDALSATGAILITSLSVAIADVIADSLVVERVRKETLERAGSLQSLCWSASAIGGLITAYLSGLLLQHFSNATVFEITATFPLLVAVIALLINENKVNRSDTEETKTVILEQVGQLWQTMRKKAIWLPVAFLFIWQATPTADSAFFFFTTNELGFEPEFLGRVRLVTSVASLIGVFIFQRYLRTVPFRTILGWSTVIASALGMTTLLLVTHANRALGIDDHWFSLGDSLVLTVMGQITWMPMMVWSARLCPKGIEATLFALLMSIWNLSGLLSHEFGALLTAWLGITETNFDNLWILVIITNLSTLLPLPFLKWLPAENIEDVEENKNKSGSLAPAEAPKSHGVGSIIETKYFPDMVPEFVFDNVSDDKQKSS